MKNYYLLTVSTIYCGVEFTSEISYERSGVMTHDQAEKLAMKDVVHEFSGEELQRVELYQITQKEYDVFRKYHI